MADEDAGQVRIQPGGGGGGNGNDDDIEFIDASDKAGQLREKRQKLKEREAELQKKDPQRKGGFCCGYFD